ncbi:hypothetical protein HYS96_01030 [Candidatus Daviesbacteria bacterium]|nr:hypothetical protein [Candidatus Daviesbacteria bacterium]
MEKAILKTLIYADIFDYPLNTYEIHKWLIGKKARLRQVESALGGLVQSAKLKVQSGYYFLPRRDGLVVKRKRREEQSEKYLRKAQVLASLLKIVPWIKLIGVSGGLAMGNASKSDDIDLFIITSKNRLWISRLLALGLLSLTGQRRKVGDFGRKIAGKLCLNILLEEDRLEQNNKDIYLAHEVLQMRVLWQRDGIYSKYLSDNEWAFKFLPNWVGERIKNNELRIKHKKHNSLFLPLNSTLNIFERMAQKFQLWYMQTPQGMERIEDGALYFHPLDYRSRILDAYQKKVVKLISP